MCLKRYSFTDDGKAIRLNTQIDIPTEIGLPHFISDDRMDEDGPIYGSFKLSLQSVVCHRGTSVDSGHYISLVRGTNTSIEADVNLRPSRIQDTSQWMRFDDLAAERITIVDINQALKDEDPYLLFYQIVPIDNDPGNVVDEESLPVYAESEAQDSGVSRASVASFKLSGSSDETPPQSRPSVEVTALEDDGRGRSPLREPRIHSVTFAQPENHGELAVPEPDSSQSSSRRGSSHGKSGSQSRSQSQTGERFSMSLSKLARRKSKEAVPLLGHTAEVDAVTEDGVEVPVAEDEKVRGFLRREGKREKSKSRLSKVSNLSGKARGEKPDRECSVM